MSKFFTARASFLYLLYFLNFLLEANWRSLPIATLSFAR